MTTATSLDVEGRAKSGRRLPERPTLVTPEDEREFQLAMEAYKRRSGRLFPTWCEVLEVLRSLGYDRRIWKPVDPWAVATFDRPGVDGAEVPVIGWFSTVETDATV